MPESASFVPKLTLATPSRGGLPYIFPELLPPPRIGDAGFDGQDAWLRWPYGQCRAYFFDPSLERFQDLLLGWFGGSSFLMADSFRFGIRLNGAVAVPGGVV